jgi:uncharacterized protein YgbK (DUF1537 family)
MGIVRIGIIADDLTGAADTGIQFAKRDFYTILLPFGLKDAETERYLHKAQIVALNTGTRGMQAELAYDKVRKATDLLMRMLHPQSIYKKVDSTLRGNVGAEIEAVMDATGNEPAILAPAFPDCNRTTEGGIHFVNGQPLSQTEVASDPVNPVDESHVPTLIRAQTRLKVGHIHLEEVRHDSKSLQRSISRHVKDGEKIIVLDAVTDDDLSNIAEAGISMSSPPLMVGSAGLADQLSRLLKGFDTASPTQRKRREHADRLSRSSRVTISAISTTSTIQKSEGVIIIISGSLSAVTSEQLDEIRRTGKGKIIPVEVHRLIEDQEAGSSLSSNELKEQESKIVSEIISATEENKVVGVQSVRGAHCDEQNIGKRHDMPLQVVEYLGRIAFQVARNCPQPIRGLIITGGDTALAVFKHLGISQVRLMDEILPGVPYGQIADGKFAGLTLVTKAGAFGDESALVKCIDFLLI